MISRSNGRVMEKRAKCTKRRNRVTIHRTALKHIFSDPRIGISSWTLNECFSELCFSSRKSKIQNTKIRRSRPEEPKQGYFGKVALRDLKWRKVILESCSEDDFKQLWCLPKDRWSYGWRVSHDESCDRGFNLISGSQPKSERRKVYDHRVRNFKTFPTDVYTLSYELRVIGKSRTTGFRDEASRGSKEYSVKMPRVGGTPGWRPSAMAMLHL